MKIPKSLQSSTGSGKLAARYQGLAVMVVSAVMFVSQMYGLEFRQSEVEEIIALMFLIVGAAWHLFGLARAFYIRYFKK